MQLSPIALFVYNRYDHTQQTIDSLRNNYLAEESELFIFSDASKDINEETLVSKVREYIHTVKGFKKITIIERLTNLGLSQSIITGVTQVINRYGKIIVLEDDIVTSPYFLQFMNDALSLYENEEKVISVCGYMYPLSKKYADTLFLRIADCWGWATWKKRWGLFVADGRELYNNLKARKLFRKFNLDGAFNYTKMLKRQIQGRNDSWAVRWYASAFLHGKLSLYPRKSLIMNIGIDGSGTNRGVIDYYRTELVNEPIIVDNIPILENEHAIMGIEHYLKKQKFNIVSRILEYTQKRLQQYKGHVYDYWHNQSNK